MAEQGTILAGVVTFFNSSQAMRAERMLKKAGLVCETIPGPREISPNCGVALAFDYSRVDEVKQLLDSLKNGYEAIHHYPDAAKMAKWL